MVRLALTAPTPEGESTAAGGRLCLGAGVRGSLSSVTSLTGGLMGGIEITEPRQGRLCPETRLRGILSKGGVVCAAKP